MCSANSAAQTWCLSARRARATKYLPGPDPGANQISVTVKVTNSAPYYEFIDDGSALADQLQLPSEVPVRIGERIVECKGAFVGVDRLRIPAEVFKDYAEIKPIQRSIRRSADR